VTFEFIELAAKGQLRPLTCYTMPNWREDAKLSAKSIACLLPLKLRTRSQKTIALWLTRCVRISGAHVVCWRSLLSCQEPNDLEVCQNGVDSIRISRFIRQKAVGFV